MSETNKTVLISASDFGVKPGREVAKELTALFKSISETQGEKELYFEPGEYFIDASKCEKEMFFITNTVGDNEFKKGEVPHENRAALSLKGINDLCIKGEGAVFVIDGQSTNMAIRDCENITVEGITFKAVSPDMHELAAEKVTPFYVDFRLDRESNYVKTEKGFAFKGTDYQVDFTDCALNAHWIGRIREKSMDSVRRVSHPLLGCHKIKELGDRLFRAYYFVPRGIKKGDRYYLFDVRRKYAGIFAERCKNLTLREVKQRFNYSLALVAQDCENVNVEKVDFSPEKGGARLMASVADFMQICMCRGDVNITDSFYQGAGDDCLNVHGIHFKIDSMEKKSDGGEMKVKFMHPQSHGFNPLRVGDNIEYIDTKSMLSKGKAKILSSSLLDEYTISLSVDSLAGAEKGMVIEDVTACPNLYFAGNELTRIITRGLLITTRGKVVVENNIFADTQMSSILFSDDAKSWYESGMVCDVTIRNNKFYTCGGGKNIWMLPENSVHEGAVHGDFLIEGNTFASPKNGGISAKSTRSVTIRNNEIVGNRKNFLTVKNVDRLDSDI